MILIDWILSGKKKEKKVQYKSSLGAGLVGNDYLDGAKVMVSSQMGISIIFLFYVLS